MNQIQYKISKVKEVLDILANFPEVIFRGGTALSLAYNIIQRSSEDIDFSLIKAKKSFKEIIKEIEISIKNLSWVLEVTKDKMPNGFSDALIIKFNNKGEINPLTNNYFTNNIIYLELPNKFKKKNEVPFNKMQPYTGSMKIMKVMKAEAIFKDKGMIIIEMFLKNKDFNWAITGRADARHLYDFLMLSDKYMQKINDDDLEIQVKNLIIKKDLSGFRKKYLDNEIPLNENKLWEIFKEKYNNSEAKIIKQIQSIVYPNAKKYSSNLFIKKYQWFFREVVAIINNLLINKTNE